MTSWEKGRPAREARATKLCVEMDSLIARLESGEDVCAEFHDLYQVARRYISNRAGLGSYYRRAMAASLPILKARGAF